MKTPETYTFIISRIYGPPISMSLTAWRFYLGLAVGGVLLSAMLIMSLLFLATFPHLQKVERERDELQRQNKALEEQVLSANQEIFELREDQYIQAALSLLSERADLPARDSDETYTAPVRITEVTTKVERRTVEVVFRIGEVPGSPDNRGGFLFVVFENKDREPITYQVSPTVNLNNEGFPQMYKAGIRFPRINRTVTYRRRVRLKNPNDYFTHITVYLFSLRGGLLAQDRFALDADLFHGNDPGVKIQKLLSS